MILIILIFLARSDYEANNKGEKAFIEFGAHLIQFSRAHMVL